MNVWMTIARLLWTLPSHLAERHDRAEYLEQRTEEQEHELDHIEDLLRARAEVRRHKRGRSLRGHP